VTTLGDIFKASPGGRKLLSAVAQRAVESKLARGSASPRRESLTDDRSKFYPLPGLSGIAVTQRELGEAAVERFVNEARAIGLSVVVTE
jgi:hypothetical protein